MLSITPLKNSTAAKSYYEVDNYYAKDSKEALELSGWWGKGAEKLGLNGFVEQTLFEQLLEGKLPDGQQLGRKTEKGIKHRPGYDLTFSAPKSVSLLAEIGEDERIVLAHQSAVKEALSYLQATSAQTRSFKKNEIVFESVDNLAVALFKHDTSREMDPDTHTHCVVLNMVERQDGKWRSLTSEAFFDHKMVTGLIYRSHLAVELQKLGYDITQTHADGRFEISGISKEVIQHFSKRRQQIEKKLQEKGWEGAKASEKVALGTRQRKVEAHRDHLNEKWRDECAKLKFNPQEFIQKSKEKENSFTLINPQDIARDALRYAATHLGEREAVFFERDLILEALKHSLGTTIAQHVIQEITLLEKEGHLLKTTSGQWTTLKALKLEKNNIQLMREAQGRLEPIVLSDEVQQYLTAKEKELGFSYTVGQSDAIHLVLTTQDKIVGIQGYAGTGKTTLMRAVKEVASSQNYKLIGLSPTKSAALELGNKTGIESFTLQKFLIELKKTKGSHLKDPTLIILDETSMVSSKQMNQLLKRLNSHESVRLVLLGDVQQLSAIGAGKPFAQFQKSGMKTAKMSEILRQKNPRLKRAVYTSIKGQIAAAFREINLVEVSHKETRLQSIVDEYLNRDQLDREKTFVLIPTNKERVVVNHGIRKGLKNEGLLQGAEIETQTLVSRGFSKAYLKRVTNYEIGDVVRFNKSYGSMGVKAGEYFQVKDIDVKKNEIRLVRSSDSVKPDHFNDKGTKEKKQSHEVIWNPEKVGARREGAIEVYIYENRQLMRGDKIRWLRNLGDDFVNAQTAEVLNVEGSFAKIKLQNNKMVELDLTQHQNKHWDYAFAYTVHAKQGGENTNVIAHMESFQKRLTTQQAFYVTISRAECDVKLFVDDKAECINTVQKYTGEKLSAIDETIKNRPVDENVKPHNGTKLKKSMDGRNIIPRANFQNKQNDRNQTKHESQKHWDIEEIQTKLSLQVETLAEKLLGSPNKQLSSSKELRFGKKGSLSIPIQGKHIGLWHNFESGEKGNLIQLIQQTHGCNFKEALNYAASYLGIGPEDKLLNPSSTKNKIIQDKTNKANDERMLDAADKKAIGRAERLEKSSIPINGTLAERYLREHRGIDAKIPDSFKFNPRVAYYHEDKRVEYFPALIAVAKDNQRKTKAVQVIYLDPDTAKKAKVSIPKRTYGRPSLGAVMINPGQSKVLLAEGPETGLSVAQADPTATVLITLSASNFSKVKLSKNQKNVVICMDNDGDNLSALKAVEKAVNTHSQNGKTVTVAKPDKIKEDFNDVLKNQGATIVQDKINQAVPFHLMFNLDAINKIMPKPIPQMILKERPLEKSPQIKISLENNFEPGF